MEMISEAFVLKTVASVGHTDGAQNVDEVKPKTQLKTAVDFRFPGSIWEVTKRQILRRYRLKWIQTQGCGSTDEALAVAREAIQPFCRALAGWRGRRVRERVGRTRRYHAEWERRVFAISLATRRELHGIVLHGIV